MAAQGQENEPANQSTAGQWAGAGGGGWPPTHTGWTPGAEIFGNRPFIIVNPSMHIINLSSRTKSNLVKFAEYFKSFTEKWFSHILLLMFLFAYGAFGAWLMMMAEGGVELRAKAPVLNMKQKIKDDTWRVFSFRRNVSRTELGVLLEHRLTEFEEQLKANFETGVMTDSTETIWTFWASFVYCFTVFTTIGYGHIAPITKLGRAISMGYAFFGIPFLLMVLADLGKLFTRAIKLVFKYSRKVFYAKRLRNVRKAGRRATLVPQYMTGAWGAVQGGIKKRVSKDQTGLENNVNENLDNDVEAARETEVEPAQPVPVQMLAPKTPFMYPGMPPMAMAGPGGMMSPPIIITAQPAGDSGSGTPVEGAKSKKPGAYEVDDEFNIPVSLAFLILVAYMFLGAVIFSYTDNWTLFDSFYFVYISMSTIGFGDLTPKSEVSMIAASIYLLFGLALTSMCINVIQEKLVDVFEETKIRLAMRMGLESQLIQEEESKRQEAEAAKKKEMADKEKEKRKIKEDKAKVKQAKKKSDQARVNNGVGGADNHLKVDDGRPARPGFSLQNDDIGKNMKDRRSRNQRNSPSPLNSSTGSVRDTDSDDDGSQRRKSPSAELRPGKDGDERKGSKDSVRFRDES
ncbi:Potassium channel subfamily K member 18 [Halotydeus destructor]|nr:Potassium channel subfamily K member 18 [Halotydeus destructor]